MPQPQQLPGPNADIWDWQMAGHCRGVDSSMFFHPDGERGRARAQREMRAKELCRSCPGDHPVPLPRPLGRRALRHLGRPVRVRTRTAAQARDAPQRLRHLLREQPRMAPQTPV